MAESADISAQENVHLAQLMAQYASHLMGHLGMHQPDPPIVAQELGQMDAEKQFNEQVQGWKDIHSHAEGQLLDEYLSANDSLGKWVEDQASHANARTPSQYGQYTRPLPPLWALGEWAMQNHKDPAMWGSLPVTRPTGSYVKESWPGGQLDARTAPFVAPEVTGMSNHNTTLTNPGGGARAE